MTVLIRRCPAAAAITAITLGPALLLSLSLSLSLSLTLSLSLALSPAAAVAAGTGGGVEIDTPRGGWRAGSREPGFVQEVHYPASTVTVGDHTPADAAILGRIRQDLGRRASARADRRPATLVVNGVPMPLELDEAGGFGRPYAFAAGSNGVEIRSADGQSRRRVQFFDAASTARARLRVVLSWDSPGTDVDLHVITPSGGHCFFGNRLLPGGDALDIDVTTGFGPEIFASPRPERGIWHVYLNYYGGGAVDADEGADSDPGNDEDVDRDRWPARRPITVAQLMVIEAEGTASESRRSWRLPLRAPGDLIHVTSFSVR